MSEKITCNKCGKEFDLWDIQEDFSIHRQLGYGTKYDGDYLSMNLCCDCMEILIEECSVFPIVERGDAGFVSNLDIW